MKFTKTGNSTWCTTISWAITSASNTKLRVDDIFNSSEENHKRNIYFVIPGRLVYYSIMLIYCIYENLCTSNEAVHKSNTCHCKLIRKIYKLQSIRWHKPLYFLIQVLCDINVFIVFLHHPCRCFIKRHDVDFQWNDYIDCDCNRYTAHIFQTVNENWSSHKYFALYAVR